MEARAEFTCALSIAGSDPTGGAGLQLDLQVFARHGVHGMGVPTALTVQSTRGVSRVHPIFPSIVTDQLRCLLEDIQPRAVKVGMLATDDIVGSVAAILERVAAPRVVDPVLRASDGSFLLERRAWGQLLERIIAGSALVTPNRDEALALTDQSDPERAAAALIEAGAHAVCVTGGDAEGPPDDFFLTRRGGEWLRGERVGAGPVHGTGCALSAAVAARLALGEPLPDAVRGARDFVRGAIEQAAAVGGGQRLLRLGTPGYLTRSM